MLKEFLHVSLGGMVVLKEKIEEELKVLEEKGKNQHERCEEFHRVY